MPIVVCGIKWQQALYWLTGINSAPRCEYVVYKVVKRDEGKPNVSKSRGRHSFSESHAVDAVAVNITMLGAKSRIAQPECTDRCDPKAQGQASHQRAHEPLGQRRR